MRLRLATAALALLWSGFTLFVAGCDSFDELPTVGAGALVSPAELAAARADWDADGPADYRLRYVQSCFCEGGERTITVRDGVAVGESAPGFTVDDLFDLAAAGFASDVPVVVRLSADAPRLPVFVEIGDPPGIADGAIRVEVTGFETD